jgi:hypothetical protein
MSVVETFETKTFRIPDENLELFKDKFQKLAKRAKKLNSEPIAFTIVSEEIVPILDKNNKETGEFQRFHNVKVTGQAPKLKGWEFVGTLDHNYAEDGSIVNIFRTVPGKKIPHQYHNVGTNCDHCGKNIYRKDTFIVKNSNNEFKQVGRSCLKDFLGHKSPEAIAQYAELISSFEISFSKFEGDCGINREPLYRNIDALTIAAACIREFGFVSKSAANNNEDTISTSEMVYYNLNPWNNKNYRVDILPEDKITAQDTHNWIIQNNSQSEFMFNLKQIAKLEYVKNKHLGFISAAVSSFIKERDKLKFEKETVVNEPLGKEGERITFNATVVNIKEFQGRSFNYYDSGVRMIYTLKTDDNKVAVWFSGPGKLELNKKVTITGTISESHIDDYAPFKGCLKTILKRCKVVKTN